jgi:PAS domain S-box-containing protein
MRVRSAGHAPSLPRPNRIFVLSPDMPAVQRPRHDGTGTVSSTEDSPLASPTRLEALRATGLVDGLPEESFDRLARLAGRLLRAPLAMVSLLTADRHLVKSAHGALARWEGWRELPLSHSLCRHVVASGRPLAVRDTRLDPDLQGSPAVEELGVVAYLGVPLATRDGEILGTCCVVDRVPRDWSSDEAAALADLGQGAMAELAARLLQRRAERAEAALAAGGIQAAELLESIDEAFYALDREWRLLYVNRRAEELWGRRRDDLLGRSLLELFPALVGSASHRAHARAFATGEAVRIETVSRVIGAPVEVNIVPSPSGLSVYFRDVSERRRIEQTLRERDETLALAEQSAGIGVWDVELASGMVRYTPQFFRIMGLEPTSDPVPIERVRALRHPEDRERVVAGFRRAVASGTDTYEAEYRIVRPSGRTRWIFGRGRVVRDSSGTPVRYSGVDIDITERKEAEERIRLLLREVDHRCKNLLAVVQAVAHHIARGDDGAVEFGHRFAQRLRGLAACHDLLVRGDWRGVPVADLVRSQLAHFGDLLDTRLRVSGPAVRLSPAAAQAIGMALHELGTNAIKHGAWSSASSRVELTWQVAPGDEGPRLVVAWSESGGPPVPEPTRSGFGRTVSERMAAQALDGEVQLDFTPSGLVWTLTAPADRALQVNDPGWKPDRS